MPSEGPPLRMSTPEKNEPKKHPTPGRTACAIATPESTSATCSDSPAATETGAVAPASRNGVIAIGWLASAQAHIASTMRKSQTSGLLGLTTPMIAGSASIAARPPREIATRSTPSRARGPDVP